MKTSQNYEKWNFQINFSYSEVADITEEESINDAL
jgi:hypothetical protein